jgi:hypothetical protein
LASARAFRAVSVGLVLWACGRVLSHIFADGPQSAPLPSPRPPQPIKSEAKAGPSWAGQPNPKPAAHANIAQLVAPFPAQRAPMRPRPKADARQAMPPPPIPRLSTALTLAEEEVFPSSNDKPMGRRAAARMQVSSWALLRIGSAPQPEAWAGQYGGSQIGLRARIPIEALSRTLGVSVRISGELPALRSPEIGLGVSYRPARTLPLEIIAEGRALLNRPGGIRPAVLITGGWHHARSPRHGVSQGYAQAGATGLHQPIFFADGGTSLHWPISPTSGIGAGLWGGVQGRTARLDIGPSIALVHQGARLTADWRVRIAGQARPGSGPSLTLGKDF